MKFALGKNGPYMGYWIDAAGLGACLILTIGAYALGVAPLTQRSTDIQKTPEEHRRQEQVTSDLAQSHNELAQRLDHVKAQLEDASFKLQPMSHLNQYLAQLTQLATQKGLSLHEIQSGSPATLEHYRSVPIRLSGTTTYRDSLAFLHHLNEEFPDIRLFTLTLHSSNDPTKPVIKINMGLVWHAALENKTDNQ